MGSSSTDQGHEEEDPRLRDHRRRTVRLRSTAENLGAIARLGSSLIRLVYEVETHGAPARELLARATQQCSEIVSVLADWFF